MALTEEQIAWLRRGLAMTPAQRLDWLMAAQEYEWGLIDFDECKQEEGVENAVSHCLSCRSTPERTKAEGAT